MTTLDNPSKKASAQGQSCVAAEHQIHAAASRLNNMLAALRLSCSVYSVHHAMHWHSSGASGCSSSDCSSSNSMRGSSSSSSGGSSSGGSISSGSSGSSSIITATAASAQQRRQQQHKVAALPAMHWQGHQHSKLAFTYLHACMTTHPVQEAPAMLR